MINALLENGMESLQDRFFALGVIPVIAIDDIGDAVPLCGALVNGGLPVAEITFRTRTVRVRSLRENASPSLSGEKIRPS